MRKIRLPIMILSVLALATAGLATAAHMGVFNSTYKPKAGTPLAKAGCAVCHVGNNFQKLNPYGTALKGKGATAAALKKVEKLDSDKDKFSNINEIKAGTLPGDAKSKPVISKSVKAVNIADTDPVCKMKVNKNAAPRGGKSTYQNVTYYFCNSKCKEQFDANPAKYVSSAKAAKSCCDH